MMVLDHVLASAVNEFRQREAELEEQIRRSRASEARLRTVANTDDLTGLANRRCFLKKAQDEFRRARRYATGLCAVMLDIDDFKTVNDTYGHETGDRVIAGVARSAAAVLRSSIDRIGRLGGEEFAIVLPQIDLEDAKACAERMRKVISGLEFESGGRCFRVTASVGVTAIDAMDGAFTDLLRRADRALYHAKDLGKDRVMIC